MEELQPKEAHFPDQLLLEDVGVGAGMVKWTVCSGRRICAEAIQAPVALMLRVLVSSMNSAPEASVPRTKTGTCNRMRGERRVDDVSTRCPIFGTPVCTCARNLVLRN